MTAPIAINNVREMKVRFICGQFRNIDKVHNQGAQKNINIFADTR